MFLIDLLILGLALSMDAAIAAFALSLLHERDHPSLKIRNGLIISLIFGFFQFFMLWAGSYLGYLFTFSGFGYLFQIVIGMIFILLGAKCMFESFSKEAKNIHWGLFSVLVIAFATSIDALASGISLGTLPHPYITSLEVGFVTALVCGLFYLIGQFFKKIPDRWLLRFSGSIFFVLSFEIIWKMRNNIF